jgi:redox-sensitive bicupin YhaK (pirin superfamily)
MIEHRPAAELGGGDLGWLKARHHFAIGGYGNPAHKALGDLIVWTDDEIMPGTGFPPHGHADVEIVTYVRDGCLSHRDSLGNEGVIRAGDVQIMSAGTGITHAEANAHAAPVKLFQIWLRPREKGGEPRWGAKPFPKGDRAGRIVTLASGFGDEGDVLTIRADARVSGATMKAGQALAYELGPDRKAYVVPAEGRIRLNEVTLEARDGAAVRDERVLLIEALADTEIVLVEVA